jgi:hypothetical protein
MSLIPKGHYRDWYEANAMQLSKHCLARGRYEIAEEFHRLGTQWYEANVVNKRDPSDSAEDRKRYREVLAKYKAYFGEFALLAETRDHLLKHIADRTSGVDRGEVKKYVKLRGVTSLGVICNQLDRGEWLRQERRGKQNLLHSASKPPLSDQVFLNTEIPTPEALEHRARTAKPIATLSVQVRAKHWWEFWKPG